MRFLDNRYAKVFNYKGFDICTLKSACSAKGDSMGYVIDHELFAGQEFDLIDAVVGAIAQRDVNIK